MITSETKKWLMAFVACLVVFALANLVSLHFRSTGGFMVATGITPAADNIKAWGFPFQVSEVGGFSYRNTFNELALLGNIGIAVVVSVGVAMLFRMINKQRNGRIH